jgi:hypothetical protein
MADPTSDVLFQCTDFSGRTVSLTRSVATHIGERHPEMVPFLRDVCAVLAAPDLVYLRPRVSSHLFYKLGILTGKLSNIYMVVIVRYNEVGEGEVRTAYPTTIPANSDTLIHVRPGRDR